MPKVNNIPQEKPWYRRSSSWAWIVTGVLVLAVIVTQIMADKAEERAKANRPKPRSYKEIFTPEEQHKLGLDLKMDDSDIKKPDPNAAKRVREFIEKGGNADPALDAIQDGDYHDLLDQNGGPEGF